MTKFKFLVYINIRKSMIYFEGRKSLFSLGQSFYCLVLIILSGILQIFSDKNTHDILVLVNSTMHSLQSEFIYHKGYTITQIYIHVYTCIYSHIFFHHFTPNKSVKQFRHKDGGGLQSVKE